MHYSTIDEFNNDNIYDGQKTNNRITNGVGLLLGKYINIYIFVTYKNFDSDGVIDPEKFLSWSSTQNITFAFENIQSVKMIEFHAVQVISEKRNLQLFLPQKISIFTSFDGLYYNKILETNETLPMRLNHANIGIFQIDVSFIKNLQILGSIIFFNKREKK